MKENPLQKAIRLEKEKPCNKCDFSRRINNTLFCEKTGKIILPMFEDIQVCRGKKL